MRLDKFICDSSRYSRSEIRKLIRYRAVTVNGTELTADGFLAPDRSFSRADVTALVKQGVNEIVLSLNYFQREEVYDVLFENKMESMRNCLCFDTEIENI